MEEAGKTNQINWRKFLISLMRYWWLLAATIALVAIALIGYTCSSSSPIRLHVSRSTTIDLTPEEIRSLRDIQQWEFLSISTEEMVEWHRHRALGNDHLVRIYTGTLRIGIDMEKANSDWFVSLPDSTARIKLPSVCLLDSNFIDETRTRSFYQKGGVPSDTLESLYRKAHQAMLLRSLTSQNLKTAERNARETFTHIFKSLGFKKVEISFK